MPALPMPELHAGVTAYKQTATFTEERVPVGLLRDHRTKPRVWAKIVAEAGRLEYTLDSPPRTFILTPESSGIAPPIAPHHVTPVGAVRFHVEFLRLDGARGIVPGTPGDNAPEIDARPIESVAPLLRDLTERGMSQTA